MFAPRLVHGLRLAGYKNCVVNIWAHETSAVPGKLPCLPVFYQMVEAAAAANPSGVVLFVVVEPGTPILDGQQRAAFEEFYARFARSFCAVAQVVEGGNLWAVTCRSIMTALRLVQRRPYPTRVFSEVEEGVQWAGAFLTQSPQETEAESARNLLSFIQEVRSEKAA